MTREGCKRQIARLSAIPGWSQLEAEALQDLVDALWNNTSGEQEAKAVIDSVLENAATYERPRIPLPDTIAHIARTLRPAQESGIRCDECRGTGWVIVQRGVYTGADRCSCRAAR